MRARLAGQGVLFAGSMLTSVVLPYQTYDLTGSTFAVGMLSLAELLPVVALALVAGVLADSLGDRRRLALAQAGGAIAGAALVANAAAGQPRTWVLYVAAFLVAAVYTLLRPWLVAVAAGAARAHVVGPAVGGLLIAGPGVATAYAVEVGAFVLALATLAALRVAPAPGTR